jgi:hypothetical protein
VIDRRTDGTRGRIHMLQGGSQPFQQRDGVPRIWRPAFLETRATAVRLAARENP